MVSRVPISNSRSVADCCLGGFSNNSFFLYSFSSDLEIRGDVRNSADNKGLHNTDEDVLLEVMHLTSFLNWSHTLPMCVWAPVQGNYDSSTDYPMVLQTLQEVSLSWCNYSSELTFLVVYIVLHGAVS